MRRALLRQYLKVLRRHVEPYRKYPYSARRSGIEGRVCVDFQVNGHGQVTSVRSGCGRPPDVLLRAAFAALSNAAPVPALPQALGTQLRVRLPIDFRLR